MAPSPKSKRCRQILAAYCREVADHIELRDWHIELVWDDQSWATADATVASGRKWVRIRWSEAFWTDPPVEQRDTVVHELVHAHLEGMDGLVRSEAVQRAMGNAAHGILVAAHLDALEHACDAITRALAPSFPLIPWPE
jgi:hypothetical protein